MDAQTSMLRVRRARRGQCRHGHGSARGIGTGVDAEHGAGQSCAALRERRFEQRGVRERQGRLHQDIQYVESVAAAVAAAARVVC